MIAILAFSKVLSIVTFCCKCTRHVLLRISVIHIYIYYMYICICILCTHMYIYIYVHICTCMHIYVYAMYVHTCICMYIYGKCMYVNVYICIHTGKAEGSGCECFNDLEGGIAAVTSGEGENLASTKRV